MEPHILFADDNSDIRELVQTLLAAAGFHVSTSDNAADILQRVATERFDAVILDYWMEEATGSELCRQIRAFDQSTPVLICSGAVTQVIVDEAESLGADRIVMGSRGLGMWNRLLLGSVSNAVVHHAKFSVEVVRTPQ